MKNPVLVAIGLFVLFAALMAIGTATIGKESTVSVIDTVGRFCIGWVIFDISKMIAGE